MDFEQDMQAENVPVESLTHREIEILGLYAAGYNNPEIAGKLFLAESTIKWYARQIYGKLGVDNRQAAIRKARSLGYLASEPVIESLPASLHPLIGRLAELQTLERTLADPGCRLLTITGPGGIGKTHLALQAATELAHQPVPIFRDGVFFVRPEPVSNPITAIADALQLQTYQKDDTTRTQLLAYLKSRQVLFLLDNFENFVGTPEAAWLVELLSAAPNIKLLVTSQTRLNLAGEQILPLAGLDLPPVQANAPLGISLDEATSYSSIQLFLQAARRNRPSFQLNEDNLEAVQQICRIIEGMPLGIELAAGWIGVLTPDEIQAEMERSLDFLETSMQGVPDRQRSLRAVFQSSWRLLSEQERAAARHLVVFQGGFDYPAAREISGLSPKELMKLVHQSWIQMAPSGRYRFYDPLRIYIEEIASQADDWETSGHAHSRYFCNLAAVEGGRLLSATFREAVKFFRSEVHNLQAAWLWAVRQHQWSLIATAVDGLFTYFKRFGRYDEAARMCASAVEAAAKSSSEAAGCLLAHLITWQAVFAGEPEESGRLLERAQQILDNTGGQSNPACRHVQAFLWLETGQHLSWRDRQKGMVLFKKSLELYQELGDEQGTAETMTSIGWVSWSLMDWDAAQTWFETGLEIQKKTGDTFLAARSLNMLGLIARDQGRYLEAERLQSEGLELYRSIGSQHGLADILYTLPYALLQSGKTEQAEKYARESLAKYKQMGYEGAFLAKPYATITFILLTNGDYEAARAASQMGLDIARKFENRQETGYILLLSGQLDLVQKLPKSAQQHFTESYQVLSALEHNLAPIPLAYLALLAEEQGQTELARDMISQAVTTVLMGSNTLRAYNLLLPAILYLDRAKRPEMAAELLAFFRKYNPLRQDRFMDDMLGESLVALSSSTASSSDLEELDTTRARAVVQQLDALRKLLQ